MLVVQLWRYPVKSLEGERPEAAAVGELGLGPRRVVLQHVAPVEQAIRSTRRAGPRRIAVRLHAAPE